jgi:hypothetical protein
MTPFSAHDELRLLLEALCEESITPAQMQRLEELVLSHPEAEAFYVQYLSLQADLIGRVGAAPLTEQTLAGQQEAAEAVAPMAGEAEPRRAARGSRSLLWGAAVLSGVAAAVALVLALGHRSQPERITPSPQGEAIDNTVAVLVQAPGAVWHDTTLPTRVGAPLAPGVLRLKAGYAHIEFYSGASVILQGPAEFRLISRMEGFCAHGKLRATVPPHAQGFKIGSPKLQLVDRGTEFGLEVAAGGTAELHVFKGQVDLFEPGAKPKTPARQEVKTGEGVRVDGADPAQLTRLKKLNDDGFPTARGLALQAQAEVKKRQDTWLAASTLRRQDPRVLVYYTFETDDPLSRTLLDQANNRQQPHDGAIVGCSWVPGRWPGKKGLLFKQVSDRVRLHVPGEFQSITLMAWVRVDGLPNQNNALMMTDGWKPGGLHWQIGDSSTIILGVQNNPRGKGAHYHAPNSITPEVFGRWLHLAVVYDAAARKVTHYLDGRPVADPPTEFDDVPLTIGDAEIGSWNVAGHRNSTPVRFFSGCMDEFLLFAAALSDEEVAQLYEEGRPPP